MATGGVDRRNKSILTLPGKTFKIKRSNDCRQPTLTKAGRPRRLWCSHSGTAGGGVRPWCRCAVGPRTAEETRPQRHISTKREAARCWRGAVGRKSPVFWCYSAGGQLAGLVNKDRAKTEDAAGNHHAAAGTVWESE